MVKAHPAFPAQVKAVLKARNSRIFLIWRDQRDALVSDLHFSQRRAGHVYRDFDDYFRRRGRKVLIRNCLQKLVWSRVRDERVKAWDYLTILQDFEATAGKILNFAYLKDVGLCALKQSVSIESLRKLRHDPKGTFFRVGGKQNIELLNPSRMTMAAI